MRLASGLLASLLVASAALGSAQGIARKVYVSVVDRDGAPVKDMTAGEFELKEGGKLQQIGLQPASGLLRIALIVDDAGSGAYRNVAGALINGLSRFAEFKVMALTERPFALNDFTTNLQILSTSVGRLSVRANDTGSLLEGIFDATKKIDAPGKRPVIVVVRTGTVYSDSLQATSVREALRKSGAKLYTISPLGVSAARSMLDQLNEVIDDGSRPNYRTITRFRTRCRPASNRAIAFRARPHART